jgi:hypothetical protein
VKNPLLPSYAMSPGSLFCRHPDIRKFDGLKSCLACGTTTFEARPTTYSGQFESDETPSQRPSYEYKRLNYELGQEIRLLVIKPGTADEPIRCDIIIVNLEDDPEYDALSYTWATEDGDSSPSGVVFCADSSSLQVTANCEAAIRRLRNFGVERVWIDALCIDQKHVNERNHQVTLMEHIYKGAFRVFVYIDTPEHKFALLFHWLNTQPRDNPHPGDQVTPLWKLQNQAKRFLRLRWFHRVWVIQEVALARTIHLLTSSDHSILDEHTVARLQFLQQPTTGPDVMLPGSLQWTPGVEKRERPDLLRCLLATVKSAASDPRDKVFAILSLIDSRTRSLIPVNYSLGVAAIYAIATVTIIIRRNDLDVLSYCSHTVPESKVHSMFFYSQSISAHMNKNSSWPSWVPNWDHLGLPVLHQITHQFTRTSIGPWRAQMKDFQASCEAPTSKASHQHSEAFSSDPRAAAVVVPVCLRLRVHFLDTIQSRSWASQTGAQIYACISEIYWSHSDVEIQRRFNQKKWSGDPMLVFQEDVGMEKHISKMYKLEGTKLSVVISQGLAARKERFFGRVEPYNEFLEAASKADPSRKVFRTKHSLGFGDYGESIWREGDVVCAIDGMRNPAILRPLSEGKYCIVCECYLMAALEYGAWKESGGRGPWGELPDSTERVSREIELY